MEASKEEKGICRGAMGQMRAVEEKEVIHDPSKNIWATQIGLDEFGGGVLNRRKSQVGRIIGRSSGEGKYEENIVHEIFKNYENGYKI